ncbi:MAG: hypothetical protein EGR23_12240 [Holdemanella biformis]|nr:hypothetical protein [Holdemanella biformis]
MSGIGICDRCRRVTPSCQHYILAPIGDLYGLYSFSLCDDCKKQLELKQARENKQSCKDKVETRTNSSVKTKLKRFFNTVWDTIWR